MHGYKREMINKSRVSVSQHGVSCLSNVVNILLGIVSQLLGIIYLYSCSLLFMTVLHKNVNLFIYQSTININKWLL